MKKLIGAVVAVVVILTLAKIFWPKSTVETSSPDVAVESASPVEPAQTETATVADTEKNKIEKPVQTGVGAKPVELPAPTAQSEQSLRKATPDNDKIRKEVTVDPHNTPPSLVSFSLDIGERMDKVKTEADASSLFKELEDCVLEKPEQKPTSVQALCLLNARRLSQKYESLKESFSSLSSRADPDAVRVSKLAK